MPSASILAPRLEGEGELLSRLARARRGGGASRDTPHRARELELADRGAVEPGALLGRRPPRGALRGWPSPRRRGGRESRARRRRGPRVRRSAQPRGRGDRRNRACRAPPRGRGPPGPRGQIAPVRPTHLRASSRTVAASVLAVAVLDDARGVELEARSRSRSRRGRGASRGRRLRPRAPRRAARGHGRGRR